jgi:hypothetical protein
LKKLCPFLADFNILFREIPFCGFGDQNNHGLNIVKISSFTYLGVGANGSLALFAAVGEEVLVALDAVGVLVTQYITMSRQI